MKKSAVALCSALVSSIKHVEKLQYKRAPSLRQISPELAREAEIADLVVLEGMGRAIETNLHARFVCDSLKLGMIKHPEVAQCLKGRLFDVVCKFDAGSRNGADAWAGDQILRS